MTKQKLTSSSNAVPESRTLLESQRVLSTLISNLPGITYRCLNDQFWTMEFMSDGVRELLGYAPERFMNNKEFSFTEVILPEDRDRVWSVVQAGLNAREPFEVTYRLRAESGKIKWVWERGRGVYSESDELLALEGFITDITDKKLAEESLKAALERFELAAKGTSDGIWDWDLITNEVYFSPRWKEQLGYEDQEIINNFDSWEKLVHPDDLPEAKEALTRHLELGEPYSVVMLSLIHI